MTADEARTARCPNRGCRADLCIPSDARMGVRHCACLHRPIELLERGAEPVLIEAERRDEDGRIRPVTESQFKIAGLGCGHDHGRAAREAGKCRPVEDVMTDLI